MSQRPNLNRNRNKVPWGLSKPNMNGQQFYRRLSKNEKNGQKSHKITHYSMKNMGGIRFSTYVVRVQISKTGYNMLKL